MSYEVVFTTLEVKIKKAKKFTEDELFDIGSAIEVDADYDGPSRITEVECRDVTVEDGFIYLELCMYIETQGEGDDDDEDEVEDPADVAANATYTLDLDMSDYEFENFSGEVEIKKFSVSEIQVC